MGPVYRFFDLISFARLLKALPRLPNKDNVGYIDPRATSTDLNAAFKKYSNAIVWTYLGKESAVSKDDFKQPQMLPAGEKVTPKK